MLAPVVIFVYNRPEHTKRTIEALSTNLLAKKTDVYIYADAAKNDSSKQNVKLVREYLATLQNKKYFKSLSIKYSEFNKGLAKSVIQGVGEVMKICGKIIVLEDDLITSKDFLKYMNGALEYYESNDNIWSISGYNIPFEIPKDYKHDIYLAYRGCSWGWATWSDRWNLVDWDVSDYEEFKKNKYLRRNLNRGGRDMEGMLQSQMLGKIDSWAIKWCYSQSKLGKMTVYPVVSRVMNIGLDGSGTHSKKTKKYDSVIISNNKYNCEFTNVEMDNRILKRFKNHYMSRTMYTLRKIKRFLIK